MCDDIGSKLSSRTAVDTLDQVQDLRFHEVTTESNKTKETQSIENVRGLIKNASELHKQIAGITKSIASILQFKRPTKLLQNLDPYFQEEMRDVSISKDQLHSLSQESIGTYVVGRRLSGGSWDREKGAASAALCKNPHTVHRANHPARPKTGGSGMTPDRRERYSKRPATERSDYLWALKSQTKFKKRKQQAELINEYKRQVLNAHRLRRTVSNFQTDSKPMVISSISFSNLCKAYGRDCVYKAFSLVGERKARPTRESRRVKSVHLNERSCAKLLQTAGTRHSYQAIHPQYSDETTEAAGDLSNWRNLRLRSRDGKHVLAFRIKKDAPMLIAMMAIAERFHLPDFNSLELTAPTESRKRRIIRPCDNVNSLGLQENDLIIISSVSKVEEDSISTKDS
ncbi:unnamed protein product [Calicophoron daubneyi]|uniref:Uncharacterized protein n=1 Tax=Calicophoron daubneyi TaxID=300641 RepID=A0AAV2T1A0_CALDB